MGSLMIITLSKITIFLKISDILDILDTGVNDTKQSDII